MDTINALLHNTNSLRNATILAGSRGLNNKISGVTVLEMSDLNEEGSSLLNLKQGEIVITSCNDIKENVEKQLQLIYALKQRKIAGIVLFYIGYVIKSLDYSVIALCDKLDLPLICPPNDPQISYASVMNDIMGLLMRKSEHESKKERTILKGIMELNQKQRSFSEGLKFLSDSYDITLMLLENSMEEICSCGLDILQMKELLKKQGLFDDRKDNVFFFIDDGNRCVWKKIWHNNTYLWLGMFSRTQQLHNVSFIMQNFEMIIDIWEKDILHKSQHELILSILSDNRSQAFAVAEKQKIDLEKAVGVICIAKQGDFEKNRNIKILMDSIIKQEGFRVVHTEVQQKSVYLLFGHEENKFLDVKNSIENISNFPYHTIVATVYGKEDLFLFLPKVIEVFAGLKEIKNSRIYDRSEIQSILQMQFLLHSPMRILYQSMQNRLDIYDKKNKSNLKKMIVDCCLEYKMNLKEMAKAEFIHYNTVQYRMKKIEELLQINLKRPSDMDTLYTLALFMKMKEK